MAKHSVPGTYVNEIDNSVVNETTPLVATGAIVMKSNKGKPNQRILVHSLDEFTQEFGLPENDNDYGHFGAEQYLAESKNLYVVRATMGDENYAQIQYPYDKLAYGENVYKSTDTAEFKFIDNQDVNKLVLLSNTIMTDEQILNLTTIKEGQTDAEYENPYDDTEVSGMVLAQKAFRANTYDLIEDSPSAFGVYKKCYEKEMGHYISYVNGLGSSEGQVTSWDDDLIFTKEAWADGTVNARDITINYNMWNAKIDDEELSGFKTTFNIPKAETLNTKNHQVSFWLNYTGEGISKKIYDNEDAEIKYSDLFKEENFYKGTTTSDFIDELGDSSADNAMKVRLYDWNTPETSVTHYVQKTAFDYVDSVGGITYQEYNRGTLAEALIIIGTLNAYTLKPTTSASGDAQFYAKLTKLALEEYGADVTDVVKDGIYYLSYTDAFTNETVEKIILQNDKSISGKGTTAKLKLNDYLFYLYADKDSDKIARTSVYTADAPSLCVIPWQDGMFNEGGDPISKLTAIKSSEVFYGVNTKYQKGYTPDIESADEVGNGDIELYNSNKESQLVIAALAPGEFGNNIGVSVITTECADIDALNGPNAFNWKYRYDDADKVDANDPNYDYIWKKVYRINVYVKTSEQTAEGAWGSGATALTKEPTEYFYVSNDPTAIDKDSGKSLFAPSVINGTSNYIYVSYASVSNATINGSKSQYAQPMQTYGIYPLTGGKNSTRNDNAEKVAALKLYADRSQVDFNQIFNVEAIDTFNGNGKFFALQNKIARIASDRTMDIACVQVTSKEAVTIKQMLSDAKMFSFTNASYVAEYQGYDKYINGTLHKAIYLPKSVAGACAMARCDTLNVPWKAPAGTTRGEIAYTQRQLVNLTDDEYGQLYDINVNGSRDCGEFGECLWGQKTALKKNSKLNRISARKCLNALEKELKHAFDSYLFESNNPTTRSNVKESGKSILSSYYNNGGLDEYTLKVYKDPKDEHTIVVDIGVVPTDCVEFIDINITINRSSATITISDNLS